MNKPWCESCTTSTGNWKTCMDCLGQYPKLDDLPLKLYVWTHVLKDYRYGMMFALARSVDEARKLILEDSPYVPPEDLAKEPRCVEKPEAFVMQGCA